MVLATFLVLDGDDSEPFEAAARAAAVCIGPGRLRDACLQDFARDLEQHYRTSFQGKDNQSQRTAYSLVTDALGEIGKHEFAHHLLGHAERIRSGSIARIDAEFEADF